MAEVIPHRTDHLCVLLEDIFQPHNASAVMRSCECFGVQNLHVIENRYTYTVNRDVAMGSSKWISLHRHTTEQGEQPHRCLEELRESGYRIAATTLSEKAIPLDALPIDQPVALAFGTEEEGLSSELLDGADLHVRIPMFGFTQSFNISVSAALCLYDLRHRLNTSSLNWQLSSARQRAVYRGWLRNSIRRCEEIEAVFLRENYPTELGGL
jgi:tRNA (guanosine-2'-O-)-methyltransferase